MSDEECQFQQGSDEKYRFQQENRDVLKDTENLIRPHVEFRQFKHDILERLFQDFCNVTYHMHASFFESETERAVARELRQPLYLEKMTVYGDTRPLFQYMRNYYEQLTLCRVKLLEYHSHPISYNKERDAIKTSIIPELERARRYAITIRYILIEKGMEEDAIVLPNRLKVLAETWKPERNFTSAEGGTWKDFWKSINSRDRLSAFKVSRYLK